MQRGLTALWAMPKKKTENQVSEFCWQMRPQIVQHLRLCHIYCFEDFTSHFSVLPLVLLAPQVVLLQKDVTSVSSIRTLGHATLDSSNPGFLDLLLSCQYSLLDPTGRSIKLCSYASNFFHTHGLPACLLEPSWASLGPVHQGCTEL